jgi:S-DNA-T family DNA segregation ATPase FtsK/SpoIIIE
MDKIKQIQAMLKTDKIICGELRRLIGSQSDSDSIIEMQGKLKYNFVEETIKEIKKTDFMLVADKLSRFEKEIETIRKFDFQVCQYLNSIRATPTIKKKELPKKVESIALDFSDIEAFKHIGDEKLPVVISSTKVIDLTKMPHLLVAGTTGSGKSVFLNVAILSLLSKLGPEQCKLALIDPKRVEFALYRSIPNLYAPIATRPEQIDGLLSSLIDEMETRYLELEKADVKSITDYNKQAKIKLPYIVLVIDELADLMMTGDKSISDKITRLAQLARAAGIHIIMATQRPVVEIMTGLIKANMPARVAFRVESKQDSRIILDESGAEKMKGSGEMLFKCNGQIECHQGIWIPEEQIKKICGR